VLHRYADRLKGDVYIVFQPAEEGGGGAARMIAEGVLDDVDVQSSFGVHLWNEKPLGWFGITPGPVMAGAERFEMSVQGAGGHGGMPNLTRDPIVAAAAIISGAQSIIARTIDPLDSAVLSFTHVAGGSNFNVIPDDVFLEGTIRALDPASRRNLIETFKRAAMQIGTAHGCEVSLKVEQVAPPLVNDRSQAQFAGEVARTISHTWIIDTNYRVMVSEDMALFLQEIPGVFIFVGSANNEQGLVSSHHTPTFDFDEQAMTNAVALLCSLVWEQLKDNDRS
jgi:amidohydrolase